MASVLKLNRNAATLLAVYDPVGAGVNSAQNVDSWNCQALTVCGFRQWVEHYQSGLSEWLEKWEIERLRKEKESREAALAAAREAANETNEATTEEVPESVFIMPDSLKQQEQNKLTSEKDVKVTKKKSSSSRKALKSGSVKSSRSSSKTKLKAKGSRSSSRNSDRGKKRPSQPDVTKPAEEEAEPEGSVQ